MPLKCNTPQTIFIISPKCLRKLYLSQWMASSAAQLPNNTETWELPGVFVPLWLPHLSNHQVLVILFLLNLCICVLFSIPLASGSTSSGAHHILLWFLLLDYWSNGLYDFGIVSLQFILCMMARSVTTVLKVQWFPTAIKMKSNSLQRFARFFYDLVSASFPESRLSMTPHTPTISPSLFDIINLLQLSPCSRQPAIWCPCGPRTCQWFIIGYSFCLEYSFSVESHRACSLLGFQHFIQISPWSCSRPPYLKLQAMSPSSSRPHHFPCFVFSYCTFHHVMLYVLQIFRLSCS